MSAGDNSSVPRFLDDVASPDVEYCDKTDTYRTEFDSRTRTATEAVVSAVETATGRESLDLPTLYTVIDPDALEALLRTPSPSRLPGVTVTFDYADCEVTVKNHGTILVEPRSSNS